jgi:TonB family protein
MKSRRILLGVLTLSLMTIIFSGCRSNDIKVTQEPTVADTVSTNNDQDIDSTESKGFKLTEYDTPPVPTQNPMPTYPARFKKTGIQGVVVLDVEVLANGTVGDVRVMKSLLSGENGLDEAAVVMVKTWMFKPAMLDNKPVAARVNIPVPFTLK